MAQVTTQMRTLRLVPAGDGVLSLRAAVPGPVYRRPQAAAEIRGENRAAAVSAVDARWVLAARAASWLEGGRAALLAPDRRRRLMTMADGLGLRPFDASLVIAIVQDAARRGQPVLGAETEHRIGLVAPARKSEALTPLDLLVCSVCLASVICFAVVKWFGG